VRGPDRNPGLPAPAPGSSHPSAVVGSSSSRIFRLATLAPIAIVTRWRMAAREARAGNWRSRALGALICTSSSSSSGRGTAGRGAPRELKMMTRRPRSAALRCSGNGFSCALRFPGNTIAIRRPRQRRQSRGRGAQQLPRRDKRMLPRDVRGASTQSENRQIRSCDFPQTRFTNDPEAFVFPEGQRSTSLSGGQQTVLIRR